MEKIKIFVDEPGAVEESVNKWIAHSDAEVISIQMCATSNANGTVTATVLIHYE